MIREEMQQQAPVPGAEAQPPEQEVPEEESNVAPEEQEIYDTVVVTAHAYLYSPGSAKMVVDKLKTQSKEKSLGFAIGHTCAMILLSIKGARAKQGMEPISADVMFAAGQEVLAEIMTIADKAGLAKEDDVELFKVAAFEAAKAYGDSELKSGDVTPEMQQEAKQEIDAVRSMVPGEKRGLIGGGMEEKVDG